MSISLESCAIEGRGYVGNRPVDYGTRKFCSPETPPPIPGKTWARAGTAQLFDCWPAVSEPYGIAVGGLHVDGPRGSFRVADTTISNTSPGRCSHSDTTLYISLVIIYKYIYIHRVASE
jgi:hypothetical protein